MKRIANLIPFKLCAAGLVLSCASCTVSPEIQVNEVLFEEADDESGSMTLIVSAPQDLRALAQKNNIDAYALLHVCNNEDPYGTVSYLREANNNPDLEYSYEFKFPNSIGLQISSRGSSGPIGMGWPVEVLQKNGVCLQLRGANMSGINIRSNVVELLQAKEILLRSEE
ncbi:MAG: hypothetical protein AAF331_09670 [Pseudomonadota bacterium]